MNNPRILFWHRKDLRINDNKALTKALSLSSAITATYILDKNYSYDFNADSRAWFLGNSLEELSKNWKNLGSRMIIQEGNPLILIPQLAKFIDADNFADGVNSTADPSAEFPKEIYSIDRKSAETRETVEFELAAPTDLAGVRIPKRQATRSLFPAIGTFTQ